MNGMPDDFAAYQHDLALKAEAYRRVQATQLLDMLKRMGLAAACELRPAEPPASVPWTLTDDDARFLQRLVIRPE